MKPLTVEQDRQRLIRLVHVGRRELGLDEETYRLLLATTVKGKSSSSEMSVPELEKVVRVMRAKGFKVRSKAGSRRQAVDPQSSKVRALWLELHRLGYVEDASEKALGAWVHRMTKVDALQWLSARQASLVIEELKKWLGRDRAKIEAMVGALVATGHLEEAAVDIDRLCCQVTGQAELNRQAAADLLAHLRGLSHVV